MNRFTPLLKDISETLDLPQPVKSRILLEISADLNDLFHYYLDQGFSEAGAAAKAREKFEVTPEALSELAGIHQPVFRRWLDKFSQRAQSRWEKLFLAAVLLIFFLPAFVQFLTTDFFTESSFFIWPLFVVAILTVTLFLGKFYQLFIKKEHRIATLHRGLSLFAVLGGGALFISLLGYFADLYSLSFEAQLFANNPLLMVILNTGIPAHQDILNQVSKWLIGSSAMVMVGMLTALLAGIFWYFLALKISKIEQAEAAVLLGE